MQLRIKRGSGPFKDMQEAFTSRDARMSLFPVLGALLERDAKRGARADIGGNFGNEIANSVTYDYTADKLTVGATHFAATHKQYGGTISAPGKGPGAKKAKYLTIPIADAAKRKTARMFNDTFILARPGKNSLIMQKMGAGSIRPLFVLVKSVTQKGVHWFPERAAQERAAATAMKLWVQKRKAM